MKETLLKKVKPECGKTHGSAWFLRRGSIPRTPSNINH